MMCLLSHYFPNDTALNLKDILLVVKLGDSTLWLLLST